MGLSMSLVMRVALSVSVFMLVSKGRNMRIMVAVGDFLTMSVA